MTNFNLKEVFYDLGGGKNCVPAMKALSGAGYSEGSSNVADGLLVVAVVVEVVVAVMRLSG